MAPHNEGPFRFNGKPPGCRLPDRSVGGRRGDNPDRPHRPPKGKPRSLQFESPPGEIPPPWATWERGGMATRGYGAPERPCCGFDSRRPHRCTLPQTPGRIAFSVCKRRTAVGPLRRHLGAKDWQMMTRGLLLSGLRSPQSRLIPRRAIAEEVTLGCGQRESFRLEGV